MQSYAHGGSGSPLIGDSIGVFLDKVAYQHASVEALVVPHQNVRLSYAELKEQTDMLAAGLLAAGIEPGDRVALLSPNRAEWALVQFGAAKAGAVLVTVNPAYRITELEHILIAAGCRALIAAESFKSSNYVSMVEKLIPELKEIHGARASARLPDMRLVVTLGEEAHGGWYKFSDLIERGRAAGNERMAKVLANIQADDPVSIQFTSGTTGVPKAVTLSHHNLLNNGFSVGEIAGICAGDRVCLPVALFNGFGMIMGHLGCMARAGTIVYSGEEFDPVEVMRTVEHELCTHIYGEPAMFVSILNHPLFRKFDLRSLRGGVIAGAPCPIEIVKSVINKMRMREITIAYGMTETGPVSFQSRRGDPLDLWVSTVGKVMPHLEVKIVDTRGHIVPIGEPGELCTRGYSVMLGYWEDEERTRQTIDAAGWMHTGDIATLDQHGYCRIVGRINEVIRRGGDTLYPQEIEEYLYRHPKIRDVKIFGVPDERFGEELCAWIVLHDCTDVSPEDIRAFCRDQIAHFKIPRYIQFVDELPMTASDNVQRIFMREIAIEQLDLPQGL